MSTNILSQLVSSRRAQFDALAQAWLSSGVSTFGVGGTQGVRVTWPADGVVPKAGGSVCVAPISCDGECIGELSLTLDGVHVDIGRIQQRLEADASLISMLANYEREMDLLAADLVLNQDQLLALYHLSHERRSEQPVHILSDIHATLSSLVGKVSELTRMQCGVVVNTNGSTEPWFSASPHQFISVPSASELVRKTCQAGTPQLLGNDDLPEVFRSQVGGLLIVPMQLHGVSTAGLILATRLGVKITSPDLKLAQTISEQVAAQIENALLYQELLEQTRLNTEIELAQQMQTRLLPQRFPNVPGLEVVAGSRPALQVGGDFYDLIYKPGKPFIFSVGDATGKGLSAALVMAMSHTVLRSAANFMPHPLPANLLRRVNDNLYDDLTDLGMFVTAFAGYYLPAEHELTFANAGHSPVIMKPARGPAQLMEADGPPIGVLRESLSENHRIPFNPGDLLVLATDGFNEAHNSDDEMLGYERLVAHVDKMSSKSATAIADSIFELVEQFTAGHPRDDDQTLVVIKGVQGLHSK